MSHSSAEVTYRPAGAGHRARTSIVDLFRIPDPEAWLTNRLGQLASFTLTRCASHASDATFPSSAEEFEAIASRLTASMQAVLATRKVFLAALTARLEAAAPAGLQRSATPTPTMEE